MTQNETIVYNRNLRIKRSVILVQIYTANLESVKARTFIALIVLNWYNTYGTDASNVFTEALPPIFPLYITMGNKGKYW